VKIRELIYGGFFFKYCAKKIKQTKGQRGWVIRDWLIEDWLIGDWLIGRLIKYHVRGMEKIPFAYST
jgi:hypothetical protein